MESESFLSGMAWRNPCPSPVEEEMSSPGFRQIQEAKDIELSRGPTTGTLSSTESASCSSDMEDSSSPDILGRPTGADTASTARTDWHASSSRDSTNTIAPTSRRRSSSSISCISDGDELGNCSSEGGTNPTARSLMGSTTASTTQAVGRTGPPAPQAGASRAPSSPPEYSSSSSDDFILFVGEHDRRRKRENRVVRVVESDTAENVLQQARRVWARTSGATKNGKGKARQQGERALSVSSTPQSSSPPRRDDRDDRRQEMRAVKSDAAEKVLRQARLAWARTSGPTSSSSSSASSSPFPSSYSFSSPKASSLSTAEKEAEKLSPASLVDLSTASPGTAEMETVREVIDIVDDGPPLLSVPSSSRKRERERTGGRRGGAGDSGGGGVSGRSGSEDEPVIEASSPCDGEDIVFFDAPANTGRGRTVRASGVGKTHARRSGAAGQSSRGSSHEPALEESEDENITIGAIRRQRRSSHEPALEESEDENITIGAMRRQRRSSHEPALEESEDENITIGAMRRQRRSSHEPALEESEDENITIGATRRQRRRLQNGMQSVVTNRTGGRTRSSGNGGGRVDNRTVNGNRARGASATRQRRQTGRRMDRLAVRLQREETVQQEERDAEMARRLQSEEEINMVDWGEGNSARVVAAAAAARAAAAVARTAAARVAETAAAAAAASGSIGRGSFRLNGSSIVPSPRPRRGSGSGSGSGGTSAVEWDIAAIMNLVSETLSEFSGGGNIGGSSSNMSLMNRDLTSADYQELLSLDEHNSSFNRAKGLSAAEMSMLPQQTGNGSGPVQQCCICMEDMTSRQKITRLPACLHTFHSKCISKWLKGQATCPIDKGVVNVRDE